MNTNGTSFEGSLTWLWVHRRTRQCCCCRCSRKKERVLPGQGQQEAMAGLGIQEADMVARLFIQFLDRVHCLLASFSLPAHYFQSPSDSQKHRRQGPRKAETGGGCDNRVGGEIQWVLVRWIFISLLLDLWIECKFPERRIRMVDPVSTSQDLC